ncbi:MAG: hypothetical protein ABH865_05615 [Candidatus Omnitrophota bacterium]|nr:hypothetical protein [Candidatus Omnitrophota bacterium]
MKRMVVPLAVLFFVAACGVSFAADKKRVAARMGLSEQQRVAIAEDATAAMTAQAWTIYLTQQNVARPSVQTDTLTFTSMTVASTNLVAKGYNVSSYALKINDDGGAVWETVQRNADDDLALWRGEYREDGINGVVTMRSKSGATVMYNFSSAMPALKEVGESAPPKKK